MKKTFIIFSLLLTTSALWAHDFLTEILVFNDDYAVNPYHIAVSYDLSEDDLLKSINKKKSKFELNKLVKRSASNNPREYKNVGSTDCDFDSEGLNRTCGVFDDWSSARAAAIDLCDAYALAHVSEYPHGLVPQFLEPLTFTDGSSATTNHHVDYRFSHGLKFNCVEVLKKEAVNPLR